MADGDVPPIHLHVTVHKHDNREIGMHVEHADHVTHQTPAAEPRDVVPSTVTSSPSAAMSSLSLTTPPSVRVTMTSQLLEIIEYEETILKLRSDNNFDLAYVKALKQSKYEPEIQCISSLVSFYELSMKAKVYDSVPGTRDKITSIIRNHTQLTAPQVKSVSDDLRAQKKWLKSILFSSIAVSLFESNGDPDGAVKDMQLCVLGIQDSVEKMLKEDQSMKSVVQHHVIPLMRELKSTVENLPGVDAELKVVQLSECLCHIAYCEYLADIDDFQTNTEGVRLVGSIEDKHKYNVYGNLLNNIGSWYHRKSRYNEAVAKFSKALEVYRRVTDWPNDDEKQRCIKSTEYNLKITKEKLKK